MKRFTGFLMAVAAIFLVATSIHAQSTTGSISGTVADPNGASVVGASITVRNTATGAERTGTSNDRGAFTFNLLTPGIYTATVEGSGFKRSVTSGIVVEVNSEARVSVALEVGLPSEEVTVTATQEVINTTSVSLTNTINTRQVTDLPLPTRNPLDLAALQAGIAVVGTDTRNASVAGLRGGNTYVTQDGINVMDNFVKTSSFFALNAPSLNSTSEFSITTGTVGSDSGRGGATVNMVTRSGTNSLSGGIFYLHRNDAFNANTFFNNATSGAVVPRARQRQHFFGFDLGGPMFFPRFGEGGNWLWDGRDTAHWFFSYEGFRENFSATRNRTVLTQQARAGTFRYNVGGVTQSVNILSVGVNNSLNPVTMSYINQTPLPNNTDVGDGLNTAGFRYNVAGADVNDKFVGRYDHYIVKNTRAGTHKLEFVYNRAEFSLIPDTFNGIEAPFPGGDDAGQTSVRSLATGALVSTFGSFQNVFRVGRQWAPVAFTRLAGTPPFQVLFSGITNVDNTFLSQGRNTTVNQISNNSTYSRGNHVFRFGIDIQGIYADTFNDAGIVQTITLGTNGSNPSGIIGATAFPGATAAQVTAGTSLYVNLTGNLGSSSQTLNVQSATSGFVPGFTRERQFFSRDYGIYVQDNWRVRPNVNLNMGVRWEFMGVPQIPNGLAIQLTNARDIYGVSGFGNLFNPNAPVGAAPAVGTLNFVSGETGRKLYNNDMNNFAPFIGVAYSPNFESGVGRALFGEMGKSSFRLGYSISYLREGFTVISNAMGVGTTNPGLIQARANNTPTGVLTPAGVALPNVTFTMPITDRQNNLINVNNGLWTIDPDLRTPYVQQWNIGFEREIFKDTAIEVRYTGNHAVKMLRAYNINEVNVFSNGFINEYNNARINLALRGGGSFAPAGAAGQPACAACLPLPIMSALFNGIAAGSGWQNSGFINNLNQGGIGTMAFNLAWQPVYRANRENPASGIPSNYFVANPNALNSIILTNDSMSNYHSAQVELRRRLSNGLQFQADYTYSKALNDAVGNQTSQSDLWSFWSIRDKRFDYARSNQDQTHRFVANAIYDLPFGRGKMIGGNANGFVDRLIGGWTLGGIVTWATRPPFYFSSGIATFNQLTGGPAQLTGISFDELRKNTGIYRTPSGLFFINPDLLNITTNANGVYTGSTLKTGLMSDPAAGTWGNFPINSLNGPNFFNVDMSLIKRVRFTERVRGELKTTFINVLNHPNFVFGTQAWNSSTFGRISATSGSARIIHFTGGIRF